MKNTQRSNTHLHTATKCCLETVVASLTAAAVVDPIAVGIVDIAAFASASGSPSAVPSPAFTKSMTEHVMLVVMTIVLVMMI